MSKLIELLEANDAARTRAMEALKEGDFKAASSAFREGGETVADIVRFWVSEHDRTDTTSFVSYWDCDGCRVTLRWREQHLIATGDDRAALFYAWHEGKVPDDVESVRYERYEPGTGQRLGHGYVDPTTRKLVQSG